MTSQNPSQLLAKYRNEFNTAKALHLYGRPLTPAALRALEEYCGLLLTKKWFSSMSSGIVIAGFGEKEMFPSFTHYLIIIIVIGIPLLIFTGYSHYKKFPGFKSEAEVSMESNPYLYKLPPGYWFEVIMPYFRLQSDILLKINQNQKISDEEIKKVNDLQGKMDHLLKGGYVGDEKRIKKFKSSD